MAVGYAMPMFRPSAGVCSRGPVCIEVIMIASKNVVYYIIL